MTRSSVHLLALFVLAATSAARAAHGQTRPTFAEHVGPLIRNNCMDCHRQDGAAPFPLVSYKDVSKRADMLKLVMDTGYMPPWHPAEQADGFRQNRRLSQEDRELFSRWIATGKQKGDLARLPRPKTYPDGWNLGKPDLVVTMPEPFEIPASGRDLYRFFVLPIDLPEDRWVKAVEMRPTSRAVVHHALFFLTPSADRGEMEGDTGRRGFGGLRGFRNLSRGGGSRSGLDFLGLGGYVPGAQPQRLRDDLAIKLPKNHDLLLQTHFHPTGKPEVEQSSIGFYFTDEPPSRPIKQIQLPPLFGFAAGIDVAAGKSDFTIEESMTLPVDVEGIAIGGHAHYICDSMLMTARLPDGTTKTLLHIPEWDMDWQTRYHYKDRVALPAGTELKVKLVYDNSTQNPDNPNDPPVRIRWGRESTDEMGSVTLVVVPKSEEDAQRLDEALMDGLMRSFMSRFDRGGGFGGGGFGRSRNRRGLDRFDKNKDGKIEPSELPGVLRKRHMRRYDKNGDGVIDADEMKGR